MKIASKNKLEFILSAFQYSLKNEHIIQKKTGNNLKVNNSYDDEDF